MQLLLTQRAFSHITRECILHLLTETGGILIGEKIDGAFVVPFAIGSGPRAKRSRTRFTPDVEWQQRILDKLFVLCSANYVGTFHRHPGSDSRPSPLDYKTAKEITSSPDWNIKEAIFPIVLLNEKGIEIFPYYFSENSEDFQPISWQIIANDSDIARSILKRRIK